MIPSTRLIFLVLLLATPLMFGGAADLYPDYLPGGEAIDIPGRSVADMALLCNIVLLIVAVLMRIVNIRKEL